MKDKKKIITISITIISIIILLIGTSFAWFTLVVRGEKTITISSGELSLIIKNEANAINLEGVGPTTEEKGLESSPYEFEIENTSYLPVNYQVRVVPDKEKEEECKRNNNDQECKIIPSTSIRYKVEVDGKTKESNILGSNDNIIDEGSLLSLDSASYKLWLWIDLDAGNEAQDAYYFGKIEVEVIQNMDPNLTPDDCFVFDSSTGTISDYLCYIENTNNLPEITSVVIPSGVTSIGTKAFEKSSSSNSGLTNIHNKTNKSFNFGSITGGSGSFVTGTVTHSNGNIGVINYTPNTNITSVYTFNASTCVTGEETTCSKSFFQQTYSQETIIKYKVNSSTEKYFFVLADNGSTLTLTQRENTVDTVKWYDSTSASNKSGPLTALTALENATSGWSNVNNITYTMGTTVFKDNKYTGCDGNLTCSKNTYTLSYRTVKARMITVQEMASLGCSYSTFQSCPVWLYNYLAGCTSFGCTKTGTSWGYWSMSAFSDTTINAYGVGYRGNAYRANANIEYAVRAVVVVNK